jgi:glucokinase
MNGAYSIGVDLGGTNLRIASYAEGVDFLNSILMRTRLEEGHNRVVRDLCEAVSSLADRDYGGRRLIGIGVGTPGPLELPEGILRNPPNLPGWDDFNLRSAIESTLGRRVTIESDANLAAIAETMCGAGMRHGINSLCTLTLGTGVGSGLVLDGRIWHGANGMGGEAGHIIVHEHNGAPCGCGGFGCLEQYASASGVVRMAREILGEAAPDSSHEVALLALAGNPGAIQVFKRVGYSLAIGLTSLINTLNLPLYLIGGGLCEAWDLFAPTMFSELRRMSYVYRLTMPDVLETARLLPKKTYILGAELGTHAGLLGACLLPFQEEPINRPSENVLVHQ